MNKESYGAWIAVAMLLVSFAVTGGLYGRLTEVEDKLENLEFPSASEIASLVAVPDMPEAPVYEVPEFKSDAKVADVWDKLYKEDIEALEAEALALALAQVDKEEDDELLDFLEAEFEGFDDLLSFSEDDDEREVEVLNLGLDDEEDKHVKVTFEYKFKYDLKEGVADDFKDRLYITANIVWDEDSEELECQDLIYSL